MTTPHDITAEIAPEIFDSVPTYTRTVLTATMPETLRADAAAVVTDALADATAQHRDVTDVLEVPAIDAWRSAFRDVGIAPAKYRPSVEALLRRAAKGTPPATGRPLVDLGTAVSLSALCPVGIHVVDDLPPTSRLSLRRAHGTETFIDFTGDTTHPEPGEVVYTTDDTVLTRRWVWRQGLTGSLTPASRYLAINLDHLDPAPSPHALDLLVTLLEKLGAIVDHAVDLTSGSPAYQLTWV